MTGFLDNGVPNPLSVITTASMGDLGYVVNYAASEPYTVANVAGLRAQASFSQFDLGEGRLRAQSRNVGDGVRLGGGVIHHVPEVPHRSRGNDAQGVRDAVIQEPGHQLRVERRFAPVAVPRGGTAAVLHRHLRARAIGLTSVAVKCR